MSLKDIKLRLLTGNYYRINIDNRWTEVSMNFFAMSSVSQYFDFLSHCECQLLCHYFVLVSLWHNGYSMT